MYLFLMIVPHAHGYELVLDPVNGNLIGRFPARYRWIVGRTPTVGQAAAIAGGASAWTGGLGAQQGFVHELQYDQFATRIRVGMGTLSQVQANCPNSEPWGCTTYHGTSVDGIQYSNIYLPDSYPDFGFPVDGTLSLAWVAAHEFGHAIGFDHENDLPSLMNSFALRGGDANREFRLNTDEYTAMRAAFTDTSSLPNLMVYGFGYVPNGHTYEAWVTSPGFSTMDEGECTAAAVDGMCCADMSDVPYVVLNGPANLDDVVVRYYFNLSSDPYECANGIAVGEMVYDLTVGMPEFIDLPFQGESGYDNGMPISVDYEDYLGLLFHFCVVIDPDDDVNESSEDDNFFTNEYADLTILGPGAACSI